MSLKILEMKNTFARFLISDITPSIANAIRRTLVNDIPKLAIEKVSFHHGQIRDNEGNVYDSSLPLFDEVVAHRLGMIPLITDLAFNFRDECSCGGEGCPLCTMSYSINKIGPGVVMSSDLQPIGNPDLIPADPNIPIVKLGKQQAILISAEAIMGRGKDHAKWQATSGVSYKYHREFVMNKEEANSWEKYKENCPSNIVKETKDEIIFTDDTPCRALNDLFELKGVRIIEDDTKFIFKFETDGSVKAYDALEYAFKRIPQRLNILLDSIVTPD